MGERGALPDPIRNIRYGSEEPCGDIPQWRQHNPLQILRGTGDGQVQLFLDSDGKYVVRVSNEVILRTGVLAAADITFDEEVKKHSDPNRHQRAAPKGRNFWERLVSLLPWVHDGQPRNDEPPGDAEPPEDDAINARPVYQMVVDFDTGSWQPEGVLRQMGYKVGKQGLSTAERHEILRQVVAVELVAASPDARDYVREWGPPASRQRLAKMVNSIAAFSRNAQRHNADYSEAIADWEDDLGWLEITYGY